jgi:N4-gp56 family major capsid protein
MANAYTATADVAGFLPNYYDKVFLERLQPEPIAMQYCVKKPLPGNSGKVAYFPRMVVSSTTPSAYKLTEGTVISTEKIDDAQVSATVEQYGNAKALWDLTELTAINGTVEETVREIGDQAKNIIDGRILQEAYGTSASPTGAGFSGFAFDTALATEALAQSAAWGGLNKTTYRMTAATLRAAAMKLRGRNVQPLEDGFYALICHSDSAMILQSDSSWQTAYQYTDPENLRKGIAGTYAGVKVQIDNNIFTSANGSLGATVYNSVLLGRGAMGVTELDGGVKTYTKKSGESDTSNPINQFITFGWKINFVPKILNKNCGLLIYTCDAA